MLRSLGWGCCESGLDRRTVLSPARPILCYGRLMHTHPRPPIFGLGFVVRWGCFGLRSAFPPRPPIFGLCCGVGVVAFLGSVAAELELPFLYFYFGVVLYVIGYF